jgi:hypothetical protein
MGGDVFDVFELLLVADAEVVALMTQYGYRESEVYRASNATCPSGVWCQSETQEVKTVAATISTSSVSRSVGRSCCPAAGWYD